ncbi:MAG TPA: hypothetical protein VF219_05640, partial [Vicinamibacterales bacterium]
VSEIWSYHAVGDQMRFTMVHRNKDAPPPIPKPAAPVREAKPVPKAPVKKTAPKKKPAAKKKPTTRKTASKKK